MTAATAPAEPFISARLVAGLVAVSALAFLVFFVLLAYAPELRNESDGGTHVLSRSAVGFAALRQLMGDTGIPVTVDRGAVPHDSLRAALTVLTPGPDNTSKEIRALRFQETTLIILPKWLVMGDPLQRDRVMKVGLLPAKSVSDLLKSLSATTAIAHATGTDTPPFKNIWANAKIFLSPRMAPVESLQTLLGPDWEPVVASGKGALLARLSGTEIYVLADPDIMNTHGLSDLATSATAMSIMRFLRIGDGPVAFDVTLNGLGRGPNLLRAMFAPPFLGATLCAILAAALFGFHAASRFGSPQPPERAFALGKQALVTNSAELIRIMRREPQMAVRYATTTRNLALQALGARRDARESEALIQVLERTDKTNFAQLAARARETETRAGLVKIAADLFRWRQRIVHAG